MSKLVLEVLADSNGLVKGLNQAQSAVDKFMKASASAGQSLGGSLNRALSSFTGLAGGGAAAAGVLAGALVGAATAAVAMTIAAGRQAEELQQLSTITGINTDKLQEYDVLLNRVGLGAADLTVMMRTLSKNMEDAQSGTGNAADRFRQLGIDIRKVTSTDDLIRKIATSLSGFANGTAKAAIESDLLGKGGLRLALAMEDGAKGIDDAAAASTRLGAALSAGQLAELGTMDDRIDDLTLAWKRFGQQIGSFVAPAIDFAARALSNLLNMASQGLKSMNALGGVGETADTRAQPPALVDTGKQVAQLQALMDAQIRVRQQAIQGTEAINRAGLQNELAILDQRRAAGFMTEHELGMARQAAMMRADEITKHGLALELELYEQFSKKKLATFEATEKGIADRLKFEQEAHKSIKQMTDAATVQMINADTTRIQSGLAVTSFWRNQLKDLVASNAFSVGLIVTTWTSGIANSIVNGGDFVKAAWKSTQMAVIQGGLNLVIQHAAQQALIVAQTAGTAAATTGIWAGATAAISGFFAATGAAFTLVIANMVAVLTAVGTFIMGVLTAVAEALTATVYGIPWAGAVVVGIALIAAALAATGNLGFKDGGIGDFGSGMPATLHGKEAIIPLNSRGAGFMQDTLGLGEGGGPVTQNIILDGRLLARSVADHLPSELRLGGVPI